ncbi:MAG: NTP transferase domain-containing protein [Planctomycetota bacterium]
MTAPASEPAAPPAPDAILLAAGKGTRMGGDLAKVLHPVADRPMLHWVVDACAAAGCEQIVIVVGYQADDVRASFNDYAPLLGRPDIAFVDQPEQLGTGHAVMMAQPVMQDRRGRDVFVLAGDGPLIQPDTLAQLLDTHRQPTPAAATLATATLDDPTGYGRVLRNPADQSFDRIVEQKDASPDQLAVREVNPSYYCFGAAALFDALPRLSDQNAQGEYYLTDVPALLKADGGPVRVVDAVPPQDILSINTPDQLAEVDRIMRDRLGQPPQSPDPVVDAGAPA